MVSLINPFFKNDGSPCVGGEVSMANMLYDSPSIPIHKIETSAPKQAPAQYPFIEMPQIVSLSAVSAASCRSSSQELFCFSSPVFISIFILDVGSHANKAIKNGYPTALEDNCGQNNLNTSSEVKVMTRSAQRYVPVNESFILL